MLWAAGIACWLAIALSALMQCCALHTAAIAAAARPCAVLRYSLRTFRTGQSYQCDYTVGHIFKENQSRCRNNAISSPKHLGRGQILGVPQL